MTRKPGEPTDNDIEKSLRGLGRDTKTDYPPDMWTATRAEYTTRVRTNQPKKGPGCPFLVLGVVSIATSLITGLAWLIKLYS